MFEQGSITKHAVLYACTHTEQLQLTELVTAYGVPQYIVTAQATCMYNARFWSPLLSEGFGPDGANGDTILMRFLTCCLCFTIIQLAKNLIYYTFNRWPKRSTYSTIQYESLSLGLLAVESDKSYPQLRYLALGFLSSWKLAEEPTEVEMAETPKEHLFITRSFHAVEHPACSALPQQNAFLWQDQLLHAAKRFIGLRSPWGQNS